MPSQRQYEEFEERLNKEYAEEFGERISKEYCEDVLKQRQQQQQQQHGIEEIEWTTVDYESLYPSLSSDWESVDEKVKKRLEINE
jgi:hypothetical protein